MGEISVKLHYSDGDKAVFLPCDKNSLLNSETEVEDISNLTTLRDEDDAYEILQDSTILKNFS